MIAADPAVVDADDEHSWKPIFHAGLWRHEAVDLLGGAKPYIMVPGWRSDGGTRHLTVHDETCAACQRDV